MQNIQLLIIDAQNDFCDLPASSCYKPALPVPGAHQDCLRLAHLLVQAGSAIARIFATLDSHHAIDIAHNTCWLDGQGQNVLPFTAITADDVRSKRVQHVGYKQGLEEKHDLLNYLNRLEQMGRTLTLWPPHCEIGSYGHNLHDALRQALRNWEITQFKPVCYVQKGENIWTENFSALQSVIPLPDDATTGLNQPLLASLSKPDKLLIAGQASSHCVRESVEDILRFGTTDMAEKLVILTDCMSPVRDFEAEADRFFKHLQAQGARLTTSIEILPELIANSNH